MARAAKVYFAIKRKFYDYSSVGCPPLIALNKSEFGRPILEKVSDTAVETTSIDDGEEEEIDARDVQSDILFTSDYLSLFHYHMRSIKSQLR